MQRHWKPREIRACPDGIVLFDGVCVLCSWWVRFVVDRDLQAFFRFLPIQAPQGQLLATRLGIDANAPQTNAVIISGRAYFKSDAAIRILERLPRLAWTRWLVLVPRIMRDWIYDRVARNRYWVFGKVDTCLMPTPDLAGHFFSSSSDPGFGQDGQL
jgi:predicted DCC family thiol-disulfide oxidoreductase YuxK